ncbi:hypothetical protein EZS27_029135 [termite gut metagenome]|uniref:Uncharacterized protein n=1 Tax=termite gut metagenome TaxID=433724 RepID=A0A5J4QH11_9ZZZZ
MKINQYSLQARVYPSFIVLMPVLLLAIFYITDFKIYLHYITAVISVGLTSYLLSQLGRDRGKNKENMLFKLIGGKPTTKILRHSNDILDDYTKERYYNALRSKINNISIPTLEEETQTPSKADEIYNSCAKYLISKTRDTEKYNLLFKENISYGFRRNLWGMKSWGLAILFVCFLIHLTIATNFFSSFSFTPTKDAFLYALFLFILIFWVFIVQPNWVKVVAIEYAKRLYETLEE